MRFLKKKIAKCNRTRKQSDDLSDSGSPVSQKKESQIPKTTRVTRRSADYQLNPIESLRTKEPKLNLKNVAKNYGRAICNFIVAPAAEDYLLPLSKEFNINANEFKEFIALRKNTLDGIEDFRELLLVREEDSEQERGYKKLFQKLGEVFIKYFSVNWIYSGRLNYKLDYVKVRNKVLRRVQNPELFTYIR